MNLYILLNITCLFFVFFSDAFVFDPFRLNIPNKVDCLINDVNYQVTTIVKDGDSKAHKFFEMIPKELNYKMFLKLTKMMPDLHAYGDKILIENEKLISNVLDSEFSNEVKKKVIGTIIDATIAGDHMASDMLSMYRDMVNHIL